MKHIQFIYLLLIGVAVTSCGDPATKGKQPVSTIAITSLSANDILDATKVNLFLKSNPSSSSREGNDFFMKGIDAYKNKKLLDSARYYFEHSLQQQPTSNAYYELGNVYKELKSYDKALASYKLAERMEYAPFSNILYQMAGTFALKGDLEMAARHIEYALQAGFTDLNKMNTDKDLDSLKKNREYLFNDAIKNGTRGMSNPETLFWLQFKKQFPLPAYPVTLKGDIDQEKLAGFISYDFERFIPEMRNARFSRDVGQSYYYAYIIGENENCTALLYAEVSHYVGDFMPKKFILASFDSKGKLIDKKRIEQFGLVEDELVDLQLGKPFEFTAKLYEMEYEKPLEEDGYWDNKIKNKKLLAVYRYKIDNKGKISFNQESKTDLAVK